jgi:trehalose 6-phosphate synthase
MKVTIRVLGAIWVSTLIILAAFAYLQVREERARLRSDLERRAGLLAESLKEAIEPAVRRGAATPSVLRALKRFGRPDRSIVVYDGLATPVAAAPEGTQAARLQVPEITEAISRTAVTTGFRTLEGRRTYVYATPLQQDENTVGALAVFLDAGPLVTAEIELWQINAVRFFVLSLGLSLITFVVLRMTILRPMSALAEWTKGLKIGKPVPPPAVPDAALFGPLAQEVSGLARNLYRAQVAAEREAAMRLAGESTWTEERLKQFVRMRFDGRPLFVASNREPLSHVWRDGQIHTEVPASGVVTALEPVMRACGGVWVAHGSGDADEETTDALGRIGLPVDNPLYTLRRVWLTKEEEEGHYYGFSNEGLWPLCHVVHARPLFRNEDWDQYRAVNAKFAVALLEEMEGQEEPMVLIQDYHLALLPALIKARRPDARVALFWHIPWPNFESFGICPWQREILDGMLGADIIGFHTQYHCNNFLESVDRTLEARIDGERFAVVRGQHATYVKPYPISVAPEFVDQPREVDREELLRELGLNVEFFGVGVERLDYTKGLPERLRALQRFFERYPEYRERLSFIQLAAPSRSRIKRYQELQAEVDETVEDVNRALGTRRWRPIVYLKRHHDRREIWPFYRHADFCMVTALHDGMNLVAKEYLSVRVDGGGMLILSRFTGAAHELRDALLVNPYDLEETAEAIRASVEMPVEERRARMRRMVQLVREQNIYRWASLLLDDLSRLSVPVAEVKTGGEVRNGSAAAAS